MPLELLSDFKFLDIMVFEMNLIFAWLVGVCYCLPKEAASVVSQEDIIPFIIGITLMGFVIIFLLAVLILCYFMKKNRIQKVDKATESIKLLELIDKTAESIRLLEVRDRKSSAWKNNKVSPMRECEITELPPLDIAVVGKASMQLPKITRYRRASVPSALFALPEASPSLVRCINIDVIFLRQKM